MHYLVTYDIKPDFRRSTNSVREKLEETIAAFGSWWHYFGDTWIVNTSMTADQMASAIAQHLMERDHLLVIAIQPPYQGRLPKEAWDWINKSVSQPSSGIRSIRFD